MNNPHKRMRVSFALAVTYAKDGAFYSAARVLRQLADDLETHIKEVDAEMDRVLSSVVEKKP